MNFNPENMNFNPENPFQSSSEDAPSLIGTYFGAEEYYMPHTNYHITPNMIDLRAQASVIFKTYAATYARDPVIPYYAMIYLDLYVSVHGVPYTHEIGMEDNNRTPIFITCFFIIAWKQRKPVFSLPDFLNNYNLPYPIDEILDLEPIIDSWLQQRDLYKYPDTDQSAKNPVTAFCFKNYLIDTFAELSEKIKICLKNFATHKLYALQYDMRYTAFKPSIVAAAAIVFCVDKFYEDAVKDLLEAFLTGGGFHSENLKRAIEMTVPGLTVNLFSDDDDDYSESSEIDDRVRFVREEKQQQTELSSRFASDLDRMDYIEMLPDDRLTPSELLQENEG